MDECSCTSAALSHTDDDVRAIGKDCWLRVSLAPHSAYFRAGGYAFCRGCACVGFCSLLSMSVDVAEVLLPPTSSTDLVLASTSGITHRLHHCESCVLLSPVFSPTFSFFALSLVQLLAAVTLALSTCT